MDFQSGPFLQQRPLAASEFKRPVMNPFIWNLANGTESKSDCKPGDGVASASLGLSRRGLAIEFIGETGPKDGFLPTISFLVWFDEVQARLRYDLLSIGTLDCLILKPPRDRLTSVERCAFMLKCNCLGMAFREGARLNCSQGRRACEEAYGPICGASRRSHRA